MFVYYKNKDKPLGIRCIPRHAEHDYVLLDCVHCVCPRPLEGWIVRCFTAVMPEIQIINLLNSIRTFGRLGIILKSRLA